MYRKLLAFSLLLGSLLYGSITQATIINNGFETGDLTGWTVSGVGDINYDGVDDLIIGTLGAIDKA